MEDTLLDALKVQSWLIPCGNHQSVYSVQTTLFT